MRRVLLFYRPHPEHLARLRAAAPDHELVVAATEAEALAAAPGAVAILGNRFFLQTLPVARRLRWFQSNSVGMDLVLSDPLLRRRGIVVTNVRGVYDDELADHALALLLAAVRGVAAADRDLRDGRWERRPLPHLAGRRVLVLGFGGVGRAICRRLVASGAEVRALCRRPHRSRDAARALGVTLAGSEALPDELAAAWAVMVALPLTPATRGLLDRRRLSLLPDGAFLVNVARGALIEDAALREQLPRLGGVGLDVFAEEPLPPGHWLREEPRAVLTPHVGRSPETGRPRWERLFEENLGRFAAGEPLLNVVDLEAGY